MERAMDRPDQTRTPEGGNKVSKVESLPTVVLSGQEGHDVEEYLPDEASILGVQFLPQDVSLPRRLSQVLHG